MVSLIISPAQRSGARILLGLLSLYVVKVVFWDSQPITSPGEIAHPAILDRILSGQSLDTRKYPFLQTRVNRDETPDLFDKDIGAGIDDFWTRFQKPFAMSPDTTHLDEQVVRGAVDELLGFNGWAAAACSSLTRPFGMQKKEDDWSDLSRPGSLYYFALVLHGADHFLIDQLAVIVQLSKRLGPNSVFVSLVDYASSDSTPFLCDMAEAVLILLGISFRIRQVPRMTIDPTASYYPLEEAYTRNLALEPLMELWTRRKVQFSRVIWLKGFTCPSDILESLRVSVINQAAMVCSMDWKEHNGFFIYNDRWRTRDMDGNPFRGSKSTSPSDEAPPRDAYGSARYTQHLPFQVFCCESGAHIVDPHKSYYEGISYQSAVSGVFNTSASSDVKTPRWSEGPCMDSSQLHFCRDMWMVAFRNGVRDEAKRLAAEERAGRGRDVSPLMEELIHAMQTSYAPTTNPLIGYPNSGDYIADETGTSSRGVEAERTARIIEDEGLEVVGRESKDRVVEYDPMAGGDGRPIDLSEEIDDGLEELYDEGGVIDPTNTDGRDLDELIEDDIIIPSDPKLVNQLAKDAIPVLPGAQPNRPAAAAANAPQKPPNPIVDSLEDSPKAAPLPMAANFLPKRPPPPVVAGGADVVPPVKVPVQAKIAPIDPAVLAAAKANRPPALKGDEPKKKEIFRRSFFDFVSWGSPAPPPLNSTSSASPRDNLRPRAEQDSHGARSLPNQDFDYAVAKILVNPRCVTTYAGVSHTQLAMDLFGSGEDQEPASEKGGKYILDEWRTAPESFVCQEMRTTGGRTASKQQRRNGFQQARLLLNGWRPT